MSPMWWLSLRRVSALAARAWLGEPGPEGVLSVGDRGLAPVHPPRLAVPREYQSLYAYLDARFADKVVLTFGQVEDLLGFALPDLARRRSDWWATAGANDVPSAHARSWTQARRIATPNLPAETVAFERVPV